MNIIYKQMTDTHICAQRNKQTKKIKKKNNGR